MNRKIVLCGVGKRCNEVYPFIKYLINKKNIGIVIGAIDINPEIKSIDGLPVWGPEKLDENIIEETIYLITVANKDIINFYKKKLKNKQYVIYESKQSLSRLFDLDITEINREFCAYNHINNMDKYFMRAEEKFAIDTFWSKESFFKQMFSELDCDNIVELACGRGRHVKQYIEYASHITLVDILQENIDICIERFKNYSKIHYYKNNGFDLCELGSEEYSALFCYDAMVHFELLDINKYLKDIFRILRKGGKALLHHSNYDAFYDARFENAIHGRAFMNYKIFAYLASHAGFHILRQEVIDWGAVQLDCITLLEKPL